MSNCDWRKGEKLTNVHRPGVFLLCGAIQIPKVSLAQEAHQTRRAACCTKWGAAHLLSSEATKQVLARWKYIALQRVSIIYVRTVGRQQV
jgi:hypothetical protein